MDILKYGIFHGIQMSKWDTNGRMCWVDDSKNSCEKIGTTMDVSSWENLIMSAFVKDTLW